MNLLNERLAFLRRQVTHANLDGWLVYDFRGGNPLAIPLLGLSPEAHLTRRWFCWMPREGQPVILCSGIEAGTWRGLVGDSDVELRPYVGWSGLEAALDAILKPGMRIAMEYSPEAAVPYVSHVDGGTLELVRKRGVTMVSSGDLLQESLCWDSEDLAAHIRASDGLMAAKDAAFLLIHQRLQAGQPVDELTVQAEIGRVLTERGLIFDHPAIVGFAGHAGDPHYAPNPTDNATLQPGQCVLLDLWAQVSGRPYADVTWMGCAGEPGAELRLVWEAVRDARDIAISFLTSHYPGAQGWEVDRVARDLLITRGYGDAFIHRLGHDIGREAHALHGPGANLDDFETHDTRRLTAGLATSIEPGVYLPERGIGVRTEVNVYYGPSGIQVTTPVQPELFVLGIGEWEAVRNRALNGGGGFASGR